MRHDLSEHQGTAPEGPGRRFGEGTPAASERALSRRGALIAAASSTGAVALGSRMTLARAQGPWRRPAP